MDTAARVAEVAALSLQRLAVSSRLARALLMDSYAGGDAWGASQGEGFMNRFVNVAAGTLAAVLLVAALPAHADDQALRDKVQARIDKARLEGEISVSVEQGAIVLDGAVATVAARKGAGRAAQKEAKVVENRLRVVPEARADAEIVKDVRSAILRYPFYTIFDSVNLGVDDGVVTLAGSVLRPNRRSEIEDAVARVRGVREIRNEVTVQPVSIFDDRLRAQLARQIYGSEDFVQYANQANPPIRILVDRGHVTLTGYVASPVERAVIDSIARQSLAFEVVNQLKVDGEKPTDGKPASSPAGIEI
jgi:hyperosmotically inducible protein